MREVSLNRYCSTSARDVDTKEVVAFRCFTRSSLDSELLLKEVLRRCEGKPLLVEKGPWYTEAFKSLSLQYRRETFGTRVERCFTYSKPSSRAYGGFPHNSPLNPITRFLGSLIAIYN